MKKLSVDKNRLEHLLGYSLSEEIANAEEMYGITLDGTPEEDMQKLEDVDGAGHICYDILGLQSQLDLQSDKNQRLLHNRISLKLTDLLLEQKKAGKQFPTDKEIDNLIDGIIKEEMS